MLYQYHILTINFLNYHNNNLSSTKRRVKSSKVPLKMKYFRKPFALFKFASKFAQMNTHKEWIQLAWANCRLFPFSTRDISLGTLKFRGAFKLLLPASDAQEYLPGNEQKAGPV